MKTLCQVRILWTLALLTALIGGETAAISKSQSPLFQNRNNVRQTVIFKRIADGKVLYQKSPDTLLIPASVTKLLTSGASLHHLGPFYSFKTRLYYTGTRKHHAINGDLIIVGSGDPLLINEKLWQMAADLRHLGIRTFTGNIVIDNSLFDGHSRDASRLGGKRHSIHAYDAPLSAFGINFNTYTVALAPGPKIGALGLVAIDPYPLKGLQLENQLRTSRANRSGASRVSRYTSGDGKTRLVVTGMIPQQGQLKKVYRSVGDATHSAGEQIRAFLNAEGIVVQGQVKSGLKPPGAKILHTIEGYPLKKIIESLNKYSNNYVADVLVKRLALEGAGDRGNLANGLEVIRSFMNKNVGVKTPFTVENGSGLSPQNRLSADQLVQLLTYMEERFDLFPEFLHSLPAGGFDGTLEDRFQSAKLSNLRGIVRAKTGTLTSPVTVASLAGYLRHKKHGLVAFAIIENGIPGKSQPNLLALRQEQDNAIARFIQEY